MHRITAALLAVGACASSLQAQTNMLPSADPVLTLEGALAAAGASSPAIEVARSGITAARVQRTVAGLRPNPSLDAMSENVAGRLSGKTSPNARNPKHRQKK